MVRDIKKRTSLWVRDTLTREPFSWQEGYAAFTVSASVCPRVYKYIAGQVEHHRAQTFREELVEFFKKTGVTFNDADLD